MIGGPRNFALRLLLIAVFLGLWEAFVRLFEIPLFILPTPSSVFIALYRGFASSLYIDHIWVTLAETLMGFALGTTLAFVLGTVIALSRPVEYFLYPFVVMFQAMPKVALAPLIIIWFGFGETSKIVVVAASCFFPMLINTLQGLKIRDRDRLELLRSLGASKWQMFYHLRLPDALPFIFAGLHVGAIFALIGSVVAEFVGSSAGLGYAMLQAKAQFDLAPYANRAPCRLPRPVLSRGQPFLRVPRHVIQRPEVRKRLV